MKPSKVIIPNNQEKPKLALTSEEKRRLVEFFSILIEIDQRNKRKSNETKII